MGTVGFLLAGLESGEATILDQGRPVEIRQKFKSLIAESDGHDYVWLRYFSDYGDVKKRIFKKRAIKSFEELESVIEGQEIDLDDKFTGEDEESAPKPAPKKRRR